MATPSPYMPREDSMIVSWMDNFQNKLLSYATTFGLTTAQTTAVTNDFLALQYMVSLVGASKTNTQDIVAYKERLKNETTGGATAFPGAFTPATPPSTTVAPGILPRTKALVKRLKAHANYTNAIGEDLGAVAPEIPRPRSPRPRGTAKSIGDSQIGLTFVKAGFSGIRVESKRGSETEWTYFGTFISSPFTDSRPPLVAGQPEVRSYRFLYLHLNDPVGEYSDVITVSTHP